jgi:valyl-tRNA synthetase
MKLPDGPYNPKETESRIYSAWEQSGYFNPDNLPGERPETYVVYMPLPNVTGSLHMGHALNNTLQDIVIRFHRMRGKRTLWLPGTDHAGISTQYVVDKALRKEGVSRFELGREKFIERVWKWKEEYGEIIYGQLRNLGVSADWSRKRFTMDPAYAEDVMKAFAHYHEKGLLYRGLRTVNWCPRCGTTLSDLELEYADEKTHLWHFIYPLADGSGEVRVATTRPETMLGDTAIAVNPTDPRWKALIGKTVRLPIQEREIPIVGDPSIETEFGTGAVKVTPAHDLTDFELSKRHNLPLLQVIDERGKMTAAAGAEFEGLKTSEAREKVVQKMKDLGLFEKEEPYEHRVTTCGRCGHAIEPIPSMQWFLKMKDLAEKALAAVTEKKVSIRPENFERTYTTWLENVRDWTISRQIWWGHRLPVWFCEREPEKYAVASEKPASCPVCGTCGMKQSEDVLDTWFSSALWPFAGLRKEDRARYYPGDTLITARDIVNLWVARMVFSGLEFMGAAPFSNVLINGTILNKEGRRMSKSLGTGVDPLKYIADFGADATRFAVVWQATGQDIKWDESAVAAGKKFMNKLWNAAKFVLANSEGGPAGEPRAETDADAAILSALETARKKVESAILDFDMSEGLKTLYDFFWHDFCDVYIEKSKPQLAADGTRETTARILLHVLAESLALLHPYLPFITEEIYGALPERNAELLMVADIRA